MMIIIISYFISIIWVVLLQCCTAVYIDFCFKTKLKVFAKATAVWMAKKVPKDLLPLIYREKKIFTNLLQLSCLQNRVTFTTDLTAKNNNNNSGAKYWTFSLSFSTFKALPCLHITTWYPTTTVMKAALINLTSVYCLIFQLKQHLIKKTFTFVWPCTFFGRFFLMIFSKV